jgi:Asp-tRNA(Asn)/Glu-tRNA(Gln) amidotransferase A subunit family amidase
MDSAFRRTIDRLNAAGFRIRTIAFPPGWPDLLAASRLVNQYEGAAHTKRCGGSTARCLGPGCRRSSPTVSNSPKANTATALATIDRMKQEMDRLFREYPVILTPAAPGPPPLLESTGDPRMNAPWTALGTPAISLPMAHSGPLPLGLQLTARPGDDARLLDFAVSASLE